MNEMTQVPAMTKKMFPSPDALPPLSASCKGKNIAPYPSAHDLDTDEGVP